MKAVTRREFLRFLKWIMAASGLSLITGPILAYFFPPDVSETPADPVLVGAVDALPIGASKTVRYGRYPAMVVHLPEGLVAYSAVCTHFACVVKWDEALGQITCPCHDAAFDAADGQVLAGPPPSPLAPLPLSVVDGQIFIGGAA